MPKERLYCAFAYNVHDSSVSFAIDNKVVLVLEAERIFNQKRKRCGKEEMEYLIKYGLDYLGKKTEDVSRWVMTTLQNPLLWNDQINIYNESGIPRDPFEGKFDILGEKRSVLVINHHLSHAATYLLSKFDNAIIITCDGGGDSECVAVFTADKNIISRLSIDTHDLINGKFYGACSYFLYKELHSEGKMMALASYGTPKDEVKKGLADILNDLNRLDYFDSMRILQKRFPNINTDSKNILEKDKLDFSASTQAFFSEHRVRDIAGIMEKINFRSKNLVMAGGVSLNLDTNTEILNAFPDTKHFIAPCCNDTGQSLGALNMLVVKETGLRPEVKLPYLGMGKESISYKRDTISKVTDILNRDGIVILHNSKAEIGPRALGNRSLIGRANSIAIKKKLSEEIKQREPYRPVAPVTIEVKVNEYFIGPRSSPFMLYKYEVLESKKNEIEGAVHHDGSARVQTITKEWNPFLYDLIKTYGEKTGTYVLLNTSLNLRGDPISNTLEESLKIYEKIQGPKVLVYNGNIDKVDD